MTINDIKGYIQYTLADVQNNQIFNLDKKRFYQSRKNLIRKSIVEANSHYNFLGMMVFLYNAVDSGVFKTDTNALVNFFISPSVGTPEYKKEAIVQWWASFFDYQTTGNENTLVYATEKVISCIDPDIEKFWQICKNNDSLPKLLNPEYITLFINKCVYQPKGKLGHVVFPNQQDDLLTNMKKVLTPFVANSLNFLSNKINPHLESIKLQKKIDDQDLLTTFKSLNDDQKITMAEKVFKKVDLKEEDGVILIKNLRKVAQYRNEVQLENPLIELEFNKLLNQYVSDFLHYVSMIKDNEDETIKQLKLLANMSQKISDIYEDEIQTKIKVRNRVLKHKNNNL